jgi:hypothetical protein
MRSLVLLLLLAPSLWAAEGRVVKVLPEFFDSKGRHALSPSLYERDAYQVIMRKDRSKRGGLGLEVQWKAKNVDWNNLKLRAEMRGLVGDTIRNVTIEEPAKKSGLFGNWAELKIDRADYATFGELVAWRVTLWEGEHKLGELQSFLWSGVTAR